MQKAEILVTDNNNKSYYIGEHFKTIIQTSNAMAIPSA